MTSRMPMPVTLCVPPRAGELCAPLRFPLRRDSSVMELTSRHRVTDLEVEDGAVVVSIEITDPETSRPVDVRFDVVRKGSAIDARSRLLGEVERHGTVFEVYGTYLGVVAEEN